MKSLVVLFLFLLLDRFPYILNDVNSNDHQQSANIDGTLGPKEIELKLPSFSFDDQTYYKIIWSDTLNESNVPNETVTLH